MDNFTCSDLLLDTLGSLLKQLHSLAEQQKLEHIALWLHEELDGYGDIGEYPDYRVLECQQFGIFIKPGHDLQHFEQIHDECLSERDRSAIHFLHLHQALLECLALKEEVQKPWPRAMLARYAKEIIPGYTCVKAWQSCSAPLAFRMLNGFVGHLWHLYQNCDAKQRHAMVELVEQHSQPHPMLHKLWLEHYQSEADDSLVNL